ncbi:unnamed protein product, partial [Discosporangium mesarthrocarpum]
MLSTPTKPLSNCEPRSNSVLFDQANSEGLPVGVTGFHPVDTTCTAALSPGGRSGIRDRPVTEGVAGGVESGGGRHTRRREHVVQGESRVHGIKYPLDLLEQRLKAKAEHVLKGERQRLFLELHKELEAERRASALRRPELVDQAYQQARAEQERDLAKMEEDLRLVLARQEFNRKMKAFRERLTVKYQIEHDRFISRLKEALGRGKGYSVGKLREELWEVTRDKRARAVDQGEAAFERACQAVRGYFDSDTKPMTVTTTPPGHPWARSRQAKIETMRREWSLAAAAALSSLREEEGAATQKEVALVEEGLKQDLVERGVELRSLLGEEAMLSISEGVASCGERHRREHERAAAGARSRLRRALELALEQERS